MNAENVWEGLLLLLDMGIKSVMIFAAAWIGTAVLSRASAATRHFVWAVAMLAAVFMPVLSALVPQTHLPLFDHREAAPTLAAETGGASGDPALQPTPEDLRPAQAEPLGTASATPPVAWSWWVLMLWGIGLGVVAARIAFGLWGVGALHRRSQAVDDDAMLAELKRLSERAGLDSPVQLVGLSHAVVPVTWGFLKPRILLPTEAQRWNSDERQMVLLHELAHIRRFDWPVLMLGRVACAMYWFNPLVWIAFRKLRAEAEAACDDWVLLTGSRASRYADHLLDIARRYRLRTSSAAATVPMASGKLHIRLQSILQKTRNRSSLTRTAAALTLLLCGLAILPIASITANPKATPEGESGSPTAEMPPAALRSIAGLRISADKLQQHVADRQRTGAMMLCDEIADHCSRLVHIVPATALADQARAIRATAAEVYDACRNSRFPQARGLLADLQARVNRLPKSETEVTAAHPQEFPVESLQRMRRAIALATSLQPEVEAILDDLEAGRRDTALQKARKLRDELRVHAANTAGSSSTQLLGDVLQDIEKALQALENDRTQAAIEHLRRAARKSSTSGY
ncbi:MAG: M56 family metallopeptidase [Phycisphaerae bacterium]